MMECQMCYDTQGPWEYATYIANCCVKCNEKDLKCDKCKIDYEYDYWIQLNGKPILVCEDCAKVLRKRLERWKKYETADLLHKRHARRISRSNSGSK